MGRIIELGEASSVSKDDYLLLSSPTLGERKILTKNVVGGGKVASRLVVFNKFMRDDNRQFTYTAEEDCIMLCFNSCINNSARTYDVAANIGTLGTVLSTDSISDQWSSPNRNQAVKCSLISLEKDETVTFTNSADFNYTTLFHIGIILDLDVASLFRIAYEVKSDNNLTSVDVNIPSDGIYFLVQLVASGDYKPGAMYATHPNTETILFNPIAHDSLMMNINFKIISAKANDTISLSYATFTNYVSKGYYLYKLV